MTLIDTAPEQWSPPLLRRFTPPELGVSGLLLSTLSGLGYAWILFQLVLGLTAGAARFAADGPAYAIISGSMEPALPVGSMVITRQAEPSDIGRYDVMTFLDPANPDRIVTHRVMKIEDDGTFITKGDANRQADSTPVPPENVIGKGFMAVPAVAKPLLWLENGQLLQLALWIISCLLAAFGIASERSHTAAHWDEAVEETYLPVTELLDDE